MTLTFRAKVCKEPSCGQRFSQLGNLKVSYWTFGKKAPYKKSINSIEDVAGRLTETIDN